MTAPKPGMSAQVGQGYVIYADAALRDNTGHHANACRHIVGELRRRGYLVEVLGNRDMDPVLSTELDAIPHFQHYPYAVLNQFPRFSQWLGRSSFLFDLDSAWRKRPANFLILNSVLPAQFEATGQWLRAFGTMPPPVAMEFGTPSGTSSSGFFAPFAPLYRKAAKAFRGLPPHRYFLYAFDQSASDEYAKLLDLPVAVLPPVHSSIAPARMRRRTPDGRITIGILGHQREEKGFDLLPDIVSGIRAHDIPVRILIHDGDPTARDTTRKIQILAAVGSDMEFEHKPADQIYWQSLLDRTDLMILPYDPIRYLASYSAVALEAVSAGIPMVVPQNTTMESLAQEYQGKATTFSQWDATSVVQAIQQAVDHFDIIAQTAFEGAESWNSRNGASAFIDHLLTAVGPPYAPDHRYPTPRRPLGLWIQHGLVKVLLAINAMRNNLFEHA